MPRSTIGYRYDRLMPIPYSSIVPTSSSGHAGWSYEPCRDIPPGLQMVECFKPFLRHLLTLDPTRPTCADTATTCWALGGEIIRRLQMDSDLRKQPIEQVVGDLIDDEGGPLLSHGEPEAEQRAFSMATCRKFSKLPGRRRLQPQPQAQNASTNDEPREPTDGN